MNIIFADTSYYIALLSLTDAHHAKAENLADRFKGQIVTTSWVLLELANFFSDVSVRHVFIQFESAFRAMADVEIISVNQRQFDIGMKLFLDRADKSWSLVDCLSFLTMERRGIRKAWTSDRHFIQAGFEALLV